MFAEDFWEVAAMSSRSQIFATHVLDGFRRNGLHTDVEVGAAGGPSTSTMTNLRKAAAGDSTLAAPRGDLLKRIDTAAGWETGTARLMWALREGPQAIADSRALTGVDIHEAVSQSKTARGPDRDAAIRRIEEWLEAGEGDRAALPSEALSLWSTVELLEEVRSRVERYESLSETQNAWASSLLSSQMTIAARSVEHPSRGQASRTVQDAAGEEPDAPGPEGGA